MLWWINLSLGLRCACVRCLFCVAIWLHIHSWHKKPCLLRTQAFNYIFRPQAPSTLKQTMDRRLTGLKVLRSPRQWLSVVFFWLVIPFSLKLVGYSWPVEHLTRKAVRLALLYVSIIVLITLITTTRIRLGSLPILLHRVAVCCAYILAGFPDDFIAVLREMFAYLFVQLSCLFVFLATPFRFVYDLFHVELAPEELEAFARGLLPAAFYRLLPIIL